MKYVVIIVSLFLTACSAWVPEKLPVRIDMDSAMPDHVKENIVIVGERLEAAIGRQIVYVYETSASPQEGRIHIRLATSEDEVNEGAGGHAKSYWDRCEITLKPAEPGKTPGKALIMHELLHCLGFDHDERGSDSIMAPNGGKGVLAQHIVDALKERAAL